ncbi:hypothetical protein D4Q76_01040 [archaeon]|nr:MAG: hypothetical protein D4Q76_01040 [archaeon]
MKKGFVLALFQTVFLLVIVIAFGVIIAAGMGLGAKITKNFIVDLIYQPVSTQDALLSLLEMKDGNGITFNKALVYAVYENTLNPKIYDSGVLRAFDVSSTAKDYLGFVYSGKKYWLFLYDNAQSDISKRIITIAKTGKDEDFNRAPYGTRDSVPIKPENYWLVLYVAE